MPSHYPSAQDNFRGLDLSSLNPSRRANSTVINCFGEEVGITFTEACLLDVLVEHAPYTLTQSYFCNLVEATYEDARLSLLGRGTALRRFEDKIGSDLEDGSVPQIYRYRNWAGRQVRAVTGTGFAWQRPDYERTFSMSDLPDWRYLRLMADSILGPETFAYGVYRPIMREGKKEVELAKIDYCLLNLIAAFTKGISDRYLSIEGIHKTLVPHMDLDQSSYGRILTQISRLRDKVGPLGVEISTKRSSIETDVSGYRIDRKARK
jgi:hypothetical protein